MASAGHRVEHRAGCIIGRKQKLKAQVADGHVFAGSEIHDCGQEAELAVRQVDNQRHERAALKAAGQWMALVAAFFGWLFDGFEMGLFPVVARPALRDLLGAAGDAEVGPWMANITRWSTTWRAPMAER